MQKQTLGGKIFNETVDQNIDTEISSKNSLWISSDAWLVNSFFVYKSFSGFFLKQDKNYGCIYWKTKGTFLIFFVFSY